MLQPCVILCVLPVCGSVLHCGTFQIDSRSQRTEEPVLIFYIGGWEDMLCFHYTFTFITAYVSAYFEWKTLPAFFFFFLSLT